MDFCVHGAPLFLLLSVTPVQAQITDYILKLTPDLGHHLLQGDETIEFDHAQGDVYLEHHKGRAAYDREIHATKARMDKLRAQGQGWPFALGGLDRCPWGTRSDSLREGRTVSEPVEGRIWRGELRRGIALYTSRNAGGLVDVQDFQHAMEEASCSDLKAT